MALMHVYVAICVQLYIKQYNCMYITMHMYVCICVRIYIKVYMYMCG